MTSPLIPLASNDLFGGAHLGQHAERIQATTIQASSAVARTVITSSRLQRNAERFNQANTIRSLVEGN
jgi:hypothetical protein